MSSENNPDTNKMNVEVIEDGLTESRKGIAELRAAKLEQVEVLDGRHKGLYKLDQKVADIKNVF